MIAEKARHYFKSYFDGVIEIILTDTAEKIWIDGRQVPPEILLKAPTMAAEARHCTWRATTEVLLDIFQSREKRIESQYISGRLSISGDMAIMSRLVINPGMAA